ncbi:hypothetical protein ACFL32_00445 [Candidatus Neomarinimicrobiota bacterium]
MALPGYKEIKTLIDQGSLEDAKEKIRALREAALELQEENVELKEQVRKLEERVKVKGDLLFEQGVYFLKKGKQKDGPFCQRCYDKEALLVRLHDDGDHWFCYGCNRGYAKKPYAPPV